MKVTVKSVIDFLIDLIDKGEIHLNDKIMSAKVFEEVTEVEDIYGSDGQLASGVTLLPKGTLSMLIWSSDPDATNDTNVYIFPKNKEEGTEE